MLLRIGNKFLNRRSVLAVLSTELRRKKRAKIDRESRNVRLQ